MKTVRKIALLALACSAGSSFAIDYNWDRHDPVETFSYTRNNRLSSFMDDARYIVSNDQSFSTGVIADLQVTAGRFASLVIEFWGDYYGPDALLASFSPGETFSFEHIAKRKKYYYLIKGQVASDSPGGTASWTLTSRLVGDAALPAGAVSPVPEPSTYAMMLLGLGVLPLAARLRRGRGTSRQAEGAA